MLNIPHIEQHDRLTGMRVSTCPLFIACILVLLVAPFAIALVPGLDRVQYGEEALSYAAGQITATLPKAGAVSAVTGDIQTTGNKRLLAQGDIIYMDLNDPSGTSPGEVFTLYRYVHEVHHPQSGEYLGNLFTMVGVVEVLEAGTNPSTVKILLSYDSIFPGDRAMRFVAPPLSKHEPRLTADSGEGMIVDVPPHHSLIAQRHVVYIDWGQDKGINPGDILEVFREKKGHPRRLIGQLKVLGVGEETSSALITKSKYPYLRGDRFAFKEASPVEDSVDAKDPVAGQTHVASLSDPGPGIDIVDEGGRQRLILEGIVDHIEFASGTAEIRSEGVEILDRAGEILKDMVDKHIRVEGHTDNVEIGPTLQRTYPSNWELSRARAGSVMAYLVRKTGIDVANLSAVGYADTEPIAPNRNEDGRQKNRRVEIVLYPTDSTAFVPTDESPPKGTGGESATLGTSTQDPSSVPASSEKKGVLNMPVSQDPPINNAAPAVGTPVVDPGGQDPANPTN